MPEPVSVMRDPRAVGARRMQCMRFVTIVELTNVASGRKACHGGNLAISRKSGFRAFSGPHHFSVAPTPITRHGRVRHRLVRSDHPFAATSDRPPAGGVMGVGVGSEWGRSGVGVEPRKSLKNRQAVPPTPPSSPAIRSAIPRTYRSAPAAARRSNPRIRLLSPSRTRRPPNPLPGARCRSALPRRKADVPRPRSWGRSHT